MNQVLETNNFNALIFTPERIENLSKANSVARTLRKHGFKLLAEDPFPVFPFNACRPVIQIDGSAYMNIDLLNSMADCITKNLYLSTYCALINGVRVIWAMGEVS